jgi:hypothetical protein
MYEARAKYPYALFRGVLDRASCNHSKPSYESGVNGEKKKIEKPKISIISKYTNLGLIVENESTKLNRLSKGGPFRRARVAEARVWCEQRDTTILFGIKTGK